ALDSSGDQKAVHTLARVLTGLEDGRSYYVVDTDTGTPGTVGLSLTRGGPAIAISTTEVVTLVRANQSLLNTIVTNRGGTHYIGTLGIDLRTGPSQVNDLRLALTTFPAGFTHQLAGAGGVPLSQVFPPSGDGVSGATAKGGSGGGLDFAFPTARLFSSSSVTTTVNAASISAAGDVTITSDSQSTQSSYADAAGGGALTVGEAHANTLTGLCTSADVSDGLCSGRPVTTSVSVGSGTRITAGDDLRITAGSDHVLSAGAKATGGGAISGKIAETTARLTFSTTVTVGSSARLTAGDALTVRALSSSDVRTTTETYSVGVGAGADSDNTNDGGDGYGNGAVINATTKVTVDNGALLTATSVSLQAIVTKLLGKTKASATAYSPIFFGVATAFANGNVDVTSRVEVDVNGGSTRITGTRGVDIRAVHTGISIIRDLYHLAVALIPPQGSISQGSTRLTAVVTSDANGLVTAGARDNSRTTETELVNGSTQGLVTTNPPHTPALALYVDAHNDTLTPLTGSGGSITWGADVTILGGRAGAPELVIDAEGYIKVLRGDITVRDDAGDITTLDVDSRITDGDYVVTVTNQGLGDVAFVSGTNTNPTGVTPVFTFRDNLESVVILDHSGQEMHLAGIDLIYRGSDTPLVQFIRRAIGAEGVTTLEFDLWRNLTPAGSVVDIQKIQNAGSPITTADIVLDASIVNPAGWTRILNTNGDIRSGTDTAWIETWVADLEATLGSVGVSGSTRLHVRLVQSVNRGDRPDTTDDSTRIVRLFVTAGTDTYLHLQAVDRVQYPVAPSTAPLPVGVDAITAGGHADLVLDDSLRQQGLALTGNVRVRVDQEGHDQNYSRHFRPNGVPLYRDAAAYYGSSSASVDSTWTFARTVSIATRVLGTHAATGLASYVLDRTLTAFSPAGTPGITAGSPGADGNIIVADLQGSANWTTSGTAGLTTPVTTLVGFTDVRGLGHIDTSVDGNVTLTEVAGDLRAGMIRSRGGNVVLTSRLGSIVDAPAGADATATAGDAGADVVGISVTLFAPFGRVGSTSNFLEIDSSNRDGALANGLVFVDAHESVFLTEVDGIVASVDDLRVDTIWSRRGDVALTTRAGSVLDGRADAAADVVGNTIDIDANGGGIGSATHDLDIDSQHQAAGDVGLEAATAIHVTETRGTLRLVLAEAFGGDVVVSVRETTTAFPNALRPDPATPGEYLGSLASYTGPLVLDGSSITRATGSFVTDGFLVGTAVRLTGTRWDGDYSIVGVTASTLTLSASLDLTGVAVTGATLSAHDTLDEDLALLHDGAVRFVETGERAVTRGRIAASAAVLLRIGDDYSSTANSIVVAGTGIDLFGDWTNGDTHWGTTIVVRGDVVAGAPGNPATVAAGSPTDSFVTNIWGHTDVDRFQLGDGTGVSGGTAVDSPGYIHLGSDTRIHGGQNPSATDEKDGEDEFTVWYLQSMNVGLGHTLVLDGQAETDTYRVYTSGSRGSARNYVANVLDAGAEGELDDGTPDNGVDELYVYGFASATEGYTSPGTPAPFDDIFLLRRTTEIAGEAADRPAFVALLHTTLAVAAPTGVTTLASNAFDVERIGYDTAINGRLTVYGLSGNDYFATDDNSAITTLDGGSGNDTFQIGQIYGLQRDASEYAGTTPTNTTGVTTGGSLAPADIFGTVATTRGWLSAGVSQSLLAQGSDDDDTFIVYSNQAPLRLEGDDGNDQFIVRAFALAQTDANGEIVWRDVTTQVAMPLLGASLFSTAATTEVRTGAGNNQVQYNINAPVSIDGGNGIDKVVVLGTEFADHIVVTSKAVYGAGLSVTYANVEILEIDGLEGDDLFDILSTAPGVATRVIGGLGSDVINVAGDVTGSVVSRDIEGTSGTVNHDVSSTNPLYDGLAAPGVDVTVARGNQGQVIIEESAGFTAVREGEGAPGADTYIVYLAQAPTANVYVTVSAARSSSEESARGGDTVHVAKGMPVLAAAAYDRDVWIDGSLVHVPAYAIVLVFTPTAWDKASAQTVSLMAVDDTLGEGTRVIVVSHSVISADAVFDHAVVRNVEATIYDDDLQAVQLVEQDRTGAADDTTIIVEGTATTGLTDTVLVRLATDPGAAVTVRLTLSDDRVFLTAPSGTITTFRARAVGVAGIYDILVASGAWQTGVLVTLHAVDDFVRQDPHTTTITAAATSANYLAALTDRIDALVVDDDTPGIVVVETGGRTLVVAGDTASGAGPGDSYDIRLTQNPGTEVKVAAVTDGQTDVVEGGRVTYQAIGGESLYRQFTGTLAINGSTLTRAGDSALGNFSDEGFAAGQRIRLTLGTATYDYVIGSVSADGTSLTLTPVGAVAPNSPDVSAVLSRVVTRGVYTGSVTYDDTTGELRRTDGQSWLDAGFLEGQQITIGSSLERYKIQLISSSTSGVLDVMTLTMRARPPNLNGTLTVMQWAAVVTFDATNYYTPVTVNLVADPWYLLQPGQENLRSFSKRPHLLSGIRGPLAVEGGTTAADRSLRPAVLLPGEGNAPLFKIAPQPPEEQQVDVLNVYADSSQEDLVGTLTATAITGLNMNATPLDFTDLVNASGGTMPFGEPTIFPAGISYGAIIFDPATGAFDPTAAYTTIEVVNLLLGQGNDRLDITSTLVPGPDHDADGTIGSVAVHGGITTVHGGGNSRVEVTGTFTATATTITRTDLVSWTSAGFVAGQVLTVGGVVVGTVSGFGGANGSTLTITGGSFADTTYTGVTVAARDPKTGTTRIGGDTVVITGGAGPDSPLVVYGDTSQDGTWYGGDPRVQSFLAFGTKPFPDEIGNGDSRFIFPVANPFVYAGHDVIDASALFAGLTDAELPTVGFTAFGGAGDDRIIGSQAADFLAGGSGDDYIEGRRGSDQIYGDNGVNVDVITRELTIPWRNASVHPNRDGLDAGEDTLHGDAAGSVSSTTDTWDDIVFGDYGSVRQDTQEAVLGVLVPGTTSTDTVYGYDRPTQLEKIQTAGRVREIRTERAEDGANDRITGDGGRDRLFGGNGDDTIEGNGQSDVVFGDHGRMLYIEGTASVTTLHLVESIDEKQGGVDTITTALGDDIVAGGAQGDTIDAGLGQNIVFGDHGRVTGVENDVFNRPMPSTLPPTYPHDDYQVPVLQLVEGYAPAAGEFGGDDTISTGLGRDMVFGGAGADTIVVNAGENVTAGLLDGNNIVFGDYGYVDYLLDDLSIPDDAHDIEVVSSFASSTSLGGGDTITAGAGNDIIIGGVGDDVLTAGQGKNLTFGDNARLSTNPALPDTHLSSFSVHEFLICIIETFGFADEDGGDDTIYGSELRDILFGGAGDDVIYGYGGDDLIFGDQGRVTCTTTPYDPDDPRNGLCVDLGGTIDFRATNVTTNTGSGNDLIYAGEGDDIVLGQQGDDIIYGEGGDDILIGGSNVSGALDGDDVIDGGAGNDLIAGDNADCCRRPDLLDPRMRALVGSTIYGTDIAGGTDGHALVTETWQNDPMGGTQYSITLLDHSDDIEQIPDDPALRLWGDDYLAGGAGDDEIFGQLGRDVIQGDGQVDSYRDAAGTMHYLVFVASTYGTTAAGPRPELLPDGPTGTRIGAWRLADQSLADTLVVHPSIERATDGDDYIEGNGGADTIFGNLGQDDIVGDSSDLYGLGDNQRVTIATKGAGATTFLTDSSGKPVSWRVTGVSADGRTLTLSGSSAGAQIGSRVVTLYGAGIQEPLTVTLQLVAGGITLLADVDWRTIGSFCLDATCRPAGADLIFGGAGTDISRNNPGDATIGATGIITTVATGHARDADVIAGDNARVLRLVGTNGAQRTPNAYLTYAYDTYAGGLRLIPRAVEMLDYTFGGPAFDAVSAATDRGAGDEVHGESGDDQVYGMTGNDVIYGDGQDDDLIGGYGDDWISGGTGDDGILGDDGRIATSRNSSTGWTTTGAACTANGTTCYSEPLYGILALFPTDPDTRTTQGNVLSEAIYTPGHVQEATINVAGVLNKAVNLTPFNVDPTGLDPLFRPAGGYDDIIFGGLGADAIHGGSGDDAITGAEALVAGYAPNYVTSCGNGITPDCTAVRQGLLRIDFGHPNNPGDVLRYNPDDIDGWHYDRTRRAGEFDLYDEYDPRRTIFFNAAAETWGCTAYTPSGKTCTASTDLASFPFHWFLNNVTNEGPTSIGCISVAPNKSCLATGAAHSDGDDIIFGDLGNDWIVGGTGRDTLWGGWGNDLLQADDDLASGCVTQKPNGTCTLSGVTWLNDGPDTHPLYEDRAYGGAGRDVLIGNTGGDRLIDWIGEFNSYIVPFAPFGIATVSRQVPPALFEFLYALSAAQGADATRSADQGGAYADRNGEPYGEIGLVTQQDHGLWQDQSGAPADPQAGNIPGGKKDVLRTADFDDGEMARVAVDSGVWDIGGGTLNVSAASQGEDSAAVFVVDRALPVSYQLSADVRFAKATGGWKANAYLIFDYVDATDFKFAGVDQSTNKAVMGHRTASGWTVDVQGPIPGSVKSDTTYALLVTVNGLVVTVSVDGRVLLTYQFDPRYLDGRAYGLNMGLVGVGSDNARGTFDNLVVQIDPPQATFDGTEDFSTGPGRFTGGSGSWSVTAGRLAGTATSSPAVNILDLPVRAAGSTTTTVEATLRLTAGASGGLVFDHYNAKDYKFVTFDQAAGTVGIGHVTKKSRVIDLTFTRALAANTDLALVLTLRGTTVTITLGGVELGSFSYDGMVGDGALGALVERRTSFFDDTHVVIGVPVTTSPDLVPPTLTVPADITRTASSGSSTVYLSDSTIGTATATDNVPGVVVTRDGVPAGNLFAIGTTTITWTATDVFGNQSVRTQTVTINPAAPTLATITVTVTDPSGGEAGSNPIAFTVIRTGSTASALAVSVSLGGTATAADYTLSVTGGTLAGSTLTLAAGSSTATIVVTPVDDSASEPTESVTLTISAGTGYATSGATTVSGSITDNDAPPPGVVPQVSIADATVLEGASPGYGLVVISLSSPAPSGGVSVRVRTSNGSAQKQDYSSIDQVVTFGSGSLTATVQIWIKDDKRREGTETFTIALSSVTGATIGRSTATVTIMDDDSALLAPSSGSQTGAAGPTTAELTGARRAAAESWSRTGLDVRGLGSTDVLVLDLPGTLVGYASDGVVYLDIDAAGHGWGPGGYDLATVLTHELGHLLGLDHDQLAGALRSTSPAAVTATRPATPVTMAAARPLGPANTLPSTGVR
ncbi:MAG: Calx-beta domain-containing protein, partial [Ornithinibacter sp.]